MSHRILASLMTLALALALAAAGPATATKEKKKPKSAAARVVPGDYAGTYDGGTLAFTVGRNGKFIKKA